MDNHQPIMVVEDDPAVRQLIGEILRDAGHDVVECRGAPEALACLERVRPALITLDLAMPSMDGIQFLQLLRGLPGLTETPVIFITAAPETLRRSLLQEGQAAISKPFYIDQLLRAVGSAIEASRPAA